MDETIAWLRERPYYRDQIQHRRTVDGRTGSFGDLNCEARLVGALEERGLKRLYDHQTAAIRAVRNGENVVLATPTASGKSLAYTVPAFERAMDRRATALYVAPQVALINDQAETLADLADDLGFASGVTVDRYTGRLSTAEKETVRDRQPTVLLTTPDMLHFGILPHAHRLWDWFVERLETVVIDEVHEYRGVFGSHVGLVLRRLTRLCERFDADPDYVCCSATIANPTEHAATVTGRPASSFVLVDDDASAAGPRHWLLWNPPEYDDPERGFASGRRRSSHTESMRLFVDLVGRGHQTVVFTRARQTAERYAADSARELRERGRDDLALSVGAYQAALTDERRRELEAGLHSGEVRGVWSTNALELGVDVGGLDAVILDGYPGTRMNTFQQAGRAGRGTDPSLVVLVGGEDQLDQYFMGRPAELFEGDLERAIANPRNEQILPAHVRSAARENWLSPDDERHFGPTFPSLVADLEAAGELQRRSTPAGVRWTFDGEGSPQHGTNLRTVGDREIDVRDRRNGEIIATLPFADGLRDAHPGAVYHHQGQSYEVVDLDLDADVAHLEPTWVDYFTRTLHEKAITVEDDRDRRPLSAREDVAVTVADVTVHEQITGFLRKDGSTGESVGEESLDLPGTTLETSALYFTVPEDVATAIRAEDDGDFSGAIHAAEHATIAMMPAELLCDRRDVGGLSTPLHPHTCKSTIFIYDGYPGGVGIAENGYDRIEHLLAETLSMLRGCECEDGCPGCVQSPHCGNANDPLDKAMAERLLSELV